MAIKVNIIADSISPQGVRLTTFELEYPRFIHAEVMTHRVFSRNAQSSRAVPVTKSLEQEIISPVVWGANKAGMSSDTSLSQEAINEVAYFWHAAARTCQDFAERMAKAGLHKQWANRCLEWFSPIKVVVTATEWDNFFWLRDDPEAAQPEIVELARKMKEAMEKDSFPILLQPGQWHLPYVVTLLHNDEFKGYGVQIGDTDEVVEVDLETAKKISAGCCAAVSYRNNPSIEKCLEIWDKLFSGPKPHLSPVEHQATPMQVKYMDIDKIPAIRNLSTMPNTWEHGITHVTRDCKLWSGNLKGWIQLRQVI